MSDTPTIQLGHEMVTERADSGRRLTRPEILAIAKAVHENAVALADEARILLQARRVARAYALAEAGAEELGKLILLATGRLWRRRRGGKPLEVSRQS